jgi:predicted ferric reductase
MIMASSTSENYYRMGVMISIFLLAFSLYIYHKLVRPFISYKSGLFIVKNEKLNGNITELHFKYKNNKIINFKPGQFGFFRILSKKTGFEEHPFTISSCPGKSTMSITVKNLGNFTSKLIDAPEGARVIFCGPYGSFIPEINKYPALFIAGGIGITPMLSIFSALENEILNQNVSLIWGVKTESEMIHIEAFKNLSAKYPEKFDFIPVCSDQPGWIGKTGFVTKELILDTIKNRNIQTLKVFFCGPENMRIFVLKSLKSIGIKRPNIYFESFSL